jgi:glycosyltransferase involved in cell wall biosynthesis
MSERETEAHPDPESTRRPLVSIVIPAFNEASILRENLAVVSGYMRSLEDRFRWELLVVNDGSSDDTAAVAEEFARAATNVRVIHHRTNFGLGRALRTGFQNSRGDYVVSLDADLSYSPDHIATLLEHIERSGAQLALASPYMKAGRVSNVPRLRALLSVWANRFLSLMVRRSVSTLTGMVRAYDGKFLRGLSLRSEGMDINPEIVHKTLLMGGRIVEAPAHLAWRQPRTSSEVRRSSMRVLSHTLSTLLAGFHLRPVIFFIAPGLLLLVFAIYVNTWMFIRFSWRYAELTQYTWILDRASFAVAAAYQDAPHTFFVGGLSAMLAIQLISLGILSLQSREYFEELFLIASRVYQLELQAEKTETPPEHTPAEERRQPPGRRP